MNALCLEPAGVGRIFMISPHLDDAVFGCGRLLASTSGEVTVATVFAGWPPPGAQLPTEWDSAAGFAPDDDVIAARREEDLQALGMLGATPCWLAFADSQYGACPPAAEVAQQLEAALRECGPDAVLFPLGLFHSDHGLAHEAARLLMREHPEMCWIAYEDALYRRIPGLCSQRMDELRQAGLSLQPARFVEAQDADARKRRAVACYRSQLRALATPGRPGHRDLFGMEAFWRVAPRKADRP